jgi:transcription termination/antitermination protein NusA
VGLPTFLFTVKGERMAAPLSARTDFALALNQVCSERGIDAEVVLDTIKQAIIAAYRKDNPDDFTDTEEDESIGLEVEIDPDTGATKIFKNLDGKKTDVTPPGFGRIAAQTAKQVILQKVREAEKSAIIDEYRDRVGAMITGMVLRFDGKNVIFDIGRGQGFMPPEEQIRGEFYKMNQRMAVYIKDIRETMRGETIIVSRSLPELVIELFRREVPEVNSGAVEIKAIAREAGIRTKLAVDSTQSGVDPVGSCVGQKGVRVQEVINELNNEKIDIIQYSEDKLAFLSAALAPAENLEIDIDEDTMLATVTVPEDQLSLAIGRGGQNVRLAAKLTGYKINIKGADSDKELSVTGEEEFEIDQLNLGEEIRNALVDANLVSISMLERTLEEADSIAGLDAKIIKKISTKLKKFSSISAYRPQTVGSIESQTDTKNQTANAVPDSEAGKNTDE